MYSRVNPRAAASGTLNPKSVVQMVLAWVSSRTYSVYKITKTRQFDHDVKEPEMTKKANVINDIKLQSIFPL